MFACALCWANSLIVKLDEIVPRHRSSQKLGDMDSFQVSQMKIKHICIAALSHYKLPSLWHLPCRGVRDALVKLAI